MPSQWIQADARQSLCTLVPNPDRRSDIVARTACALDVQQEASPERPVTLQQRWDMQRVVSEAAAELLKTPMTGMDNAIDLVLRSSGEHLAADRAYLFLTSSDQTAVSNTHEWCAPGVEPQRDQVQAMPLTGIPWWWDQISKGSLVVVTDVAKLPVEATAEKTIFEAQQIQSLCSFPLQKDGKTFGFIGYDAVRSARDWASEEIELLQIIANVVVSALARWQAEAELHGERTFLQHVIDGIDDPILVIGLDYQVLRMNRMAQEYAEKFGFDINHVTCHQALYQSDRPCSDEDHLCSIQTVLKTRLPCKTIHQHLTPTGEKQTFEIATSPLLNDEGAVIGVIETSRNITDHLSLLAELKERELRYAHLAHHDPLTGLPNRLLFADRLDRAIHAAHRDGTKIAVLYIDLDQFKHVNDSFGHVYGDKVLNAIASRLQAFFRQDDTIARMGGDEFTVILTDLRHDKDAAMVASKILNLFNEPFNIQGHGVFLGASIGISIYPQQGQAADNLVRNADTAMYRAKEQGRNTYQYYSEELTARAFERVLLESSLRNALERGELVLHYQPQLNLLSGQVSGFEALVRWQHPEMGLIPPIKFIPLAEESGIIVPMGEQILRQACRQMAIWRRAGIVPPDALISVNLSAKQFDQTGLTEMIADILDETGLAHAALELEITESTMMRAPDLSEHTLRQLRDLAVKVAIDDFGTGYSSLSYLKLFPLTKLKIDKSFVSDIPQDTNDVAIAKAVIALARSLTLSVVAEGVETQEQKQLLTREGCDNGQGYLFSRPLRAEDVPPYMQGINSVQQPKAIKSKKTR